MWKVIGVSEQFLEFILPQGQLSIAIFTPVWTQLIYCFLFFVNISGSQFGAILDVILDVLEMSMWKAVLAQLYPDYAIYIHCHAGLTLLGEWMHRHRYIFWQCPQMRLQYVTLSEMSIHFFLTPLYQYFKMHRFNANPITIGYLVTELWRIWQC